MISPLRFMCNSELKYYYFSPLLIILKAFHLLQWMVLNKCLKLVLNKPKYILFWYFVASYFNCEIFLSTIEYIEHFQAWTWHCCKWLSCCSFVDLKHAWSGTSCMPQCIWWSGCASFCTPMSTACVKVECVCTRGHVNKSIFIKKNLYWLSFKMLSISNLYAWQKA